MYCTPSESLPVPAMTLRNKTQNFDKPSWDAALSRVFQYLLGKFLIRRSVSYLPKEAKLPLPHQTSVKRKSACKSETGPGHAGAFSSRRLTFEAVTTDEVGFCAFAVLRFCCFAVLLFCIRSRAETSSLSPLIYPIRYFQTTSEEAIRGREAVKEKDMLRTDLPRGTRTRESKRWSNNPYVIAGAGLSRLSNSKLHQMILAGRLKPPDL